MSPRSVSWPVLGVVLAALAFSPTLHAEEPATLAGAEAAYLAVDFEGTKAKSLDALTGGRNEPRETLRLYTLLGVSASALGEPELAREAFRHVVALDPRGHLDKTLSPKLRAPYLEVRGELTAKGELAALGAVLVQRAGALRLELDDPAGIARGIDVSYRTEHAHAFTATRVVPDPAHPFQVSVNAARIEYTLVIRDEHGNALYRRGSAERPEVLVTARADGTPGPSGDAPPSPGGYYLTAGILAGAGLAAAGVGAYFTVRREQAAHEWNSASCEQPGATRGEQCADVDQRRATAEHLALGFYVGSGALLVSSVVTLLLAPSSPPSASRRAALPCVPGVAPLGAACTIAF